MITPKQILQQARSLIQDEAHWLKGSGAMNAKGEGVNPFDQHNEVAKCCSVGAVYTAAGSLADDGEVKHSQSQCYEPIETAKVMLRQALHPMYKHEVYSVIEFNDAPTTTHEMVLEVFDKAIKNIKE